MINVQQYKNISQNINYLQNFIIYENAKEICIKHAKIFAEAIRDSTALANWCNTNYGNQHNVYYGVDKRQPPGDTDTPYVAVASMDEFSGYALADNTFAINVICGINDDTITTTDDTNGVTKKKHDGLENIEDMRKLAETAIVDEVNSNSDLTLAMISEVDISYRTIDFFPFFFSGNTFILKYLYCQGNAIFRDRR